MNKVNKTLLYCSIVMVLILVIFGVVTVWVQQDQSEYAVEYLEGRVILTVDNDRGYTKVFLDNGGGLYLPEGGCELLLGATYRFTFWNYNACDNGFWGRHDIEYKSMELIEGGCK